MNEKLLALVLVLLAVTVVITITRKLIKLAIIVGLISLLLGTNMCVGFYVENIINKTSNVANVVSELPDFLSKYVSFEKNDNEYTASIDMLFFKKEFKITAN